jgi:hypothetical protein
MAEWKIHDVDLKHLEANSPEFIYGVLHVNVGLRVMDVHLFPTRAAWYEETIMILNLAD